MPMLAKLLCTVFLSTSCMVAAKEFADCGSTALMPQELELSPDPAEVSAPRAGAL